MIRQKTVVSATKAYLIAGIVAIVLAGCLELSGLYAFLSDNSNIGIVFIIQLPVLITVPFMLLIKDYRHATEFIIYFADIDKIVDISWIKSNYHIMAIDNEGIVFVKPEDYSNYLTWKVLQGSDSATDIIKSFERDLDDENLGSEI